jgi:hypothetical protein
MNETENRAEGYDLPSLGGGRTDPSKTQKRVSDEKRKRRRYLEKLGRKNNRGSSKGSKNATGRKNW